MESTKSNSTYARWTGRIVSALCVLFLLVDAGMKIVRAAPSVEGSVQLGWPDSLVQIIGIVLLLCTALYVVPATSLLGSVLLTGYLGGAIAIMARADVDGHSFLFPLVFSILVWAGLLLRDPKLRELMPLRRA